jgi:hypothetical protein
MNQKSHPCCWPAGSKTKQNFSTREVLPVYSNWGAVNSSNAAPTQGLFTALLISAPEQWAALPRNVHLYPSKLGRARVLFRTLESQRSSAKQLLTPTPPRLAHAASCAAVLATAPAKSPAAATLVIYLTSVIEILRCLYLSPVVLLYAILRYSL